jgi:hypothetical protein
LPLLVVAILASTLLANRMCCLATGKPVGNNVTRINFETANERSWGEKGRKHMKDMIKAGVMDMEDSFLVEAPANLKWI